MSIVYKPCLAVPGVRTVYLSTSTQGMSTNRQLRACLPIVNSGHVYQSSGHVYQSSGHVYQSSTQGMSTNRQLSACLPMSAQGTSVCRYAENQDLVNKNSNVIKEQADVIAALKERLSKQPGHVSNNSLKNDKKQIKQLEADVENLKVLIAMCLYTMLRYAMLCFAMLCHAMLCHAMLRHAMPCHAMPCHAMLSYAMPCCAVLFSKHLCVHFISPSWAVHLNLDPLEPLPWELSSMCGRFDKGIFAGAGCIEVQASGQLASADSGCQAQLTGVCTGLRPADQAQVATGTSHISWFPPMLPLRFKLQIELCVALPH